MKWPFHIIADPVPYDPAAHLKRIKTLYKSYALNTLEKQQTYIKLLVTNLPLRHRPAFEIFIYSLLLNECFFNAPDDAPRYPSEGTQLLYTSEEEFLANADDRIEKATRALVNFINEIKNYLPDATAGFSVPLIELLLLPQRWVQRFHAEYGDAFPRLKSKLTDNIFEASGYDSEEFDEKKAYKLKFPVESDLPPLELTHTYLRNTPLQDLYEMSVPFSIPRKTWASHAFLLGPSGWGKSQFLGSILRDAVEDPQPRTVILFDPHAQKDGSIFQLARERVPHERLVVIDPDTNPPDLNIFDFGVLSHHEAMAAFEFLISSLAGGLSEKQQACVEPLFSLLQNIDAANLQTLHEIIVEKPLKGRPSKYSNVIGQLNDIHRDFFSNLFYTGNFQETRDALQWKLSRALGRPAFKKMFSAARNSISMDAYLREPKVVIVSGGENALGKEGMRIFLLFLLSQYYAAAKRRTAKHLAMCLIDEAWMVLQSPLIADILVELRGFNCALCCATQVYSQIAEHVRPAVLGSTAIKAVGAIQYNDAVVLAREMNCDPSFIRDLRPFSGPGTTSQWALHVSGTTHKAMRIEMPYGTLEAMPRVSRATSDIPATNPRHAREIQTQEAAQTKDGFRREKTPPVGSTDGPKSIPPAHDPNRFPNRWRKSD